MCLQQLPGDPRAEVREEQVGSSSVAFRSRWRRDEPAGKRPQRDRAERDQQRDVVAALLPDEDAEHDAAHAEDG